MSGRRETIYSVDAEDEAQALERFNKYMAFLGAIVIAPVEVKADEPS